ncbi:MAG: RNA polymerase sigma factor [Planctomycetes bacterium]|nr:RNA polymerase sigma factor [Planctomycetota bacterium]
MSSTPNNPGTPATPNNDQTDEALVHRYQSGDVHAFETLVARYQVELFHFLARFTGNRTTADDLFQETFLQVHISAENFDTERRFRPWLFTIAANKARDHLRRNHRRQTSSLSAPVNGYGDEGGEFVDLMQADLEQPPEEVERREVQEMVRETVRLMPEHLREILLLAYFHQFAYKEVADMLQIPLGTVKSRLHAAVAAFAELWKQRTKDAPPPIG